MIFFLMLKEVMYGKFYEYCVLYYIYGKNDILEIYDMKIYE